VSEKKPKLKTVQWVFIGWRFGNEKLRGMFAPLDDLKLNFVFDGVPKRLDPGNIYDVQASDKGGTVSAAIKTCQYVGSFDHKDVDAWRMESDIQETLYARSRVAAKLKKETPEYLKALAPLRKAYRRMTWSNQRALEMLVLAELRKP